MADLAATAGAHLHPHPHVRRRWAAWLALFVAIVAGAGGTSALAASEGLERLGPVLAMVASYALCFVALTRALQVIPIGVAYALWSGVGITLVTLIGWVGFGQLLGAGELAGVALILAGAVLIQLAPRLRAPGGRR